MKKVFTREYIIMDVNKGSPIHKSRTRVNFKELVKRISIIALIAIIAFLLIHSSVENTPVLTVTCPGGQGTSCLLFLDVDDNIVGKVRYVSAEQFEEIKQIQKITIDPSVDGFAPSAEDGEFFEIRIAGYGDVCFKSDECDYIPSGYNYTLSDTEEDEMFELMSEENNFLYDQLNFIIRGEVA